MPFPGSGFVNGILVCPNVDFRQVQPTVGQMTQNGQLLIGANAAPFIRAATPTNGNNITWTLGAGSIRANLTGTTDHAPQIGNASGSLTSLGPLTNGQLIIGSTGIDPVAAQLQPGMGIAVTNGAGTITIGAWGGGVSWTVEAVNLNFTANKGIIANKAGLLTVTLPATAAIGDILQITGINTAVGWRIAQNANQRIHMGASSTTLGVGGYLEAAAIRDSVKLVCVVAGASTEYNVLSSIGNITVV